MEGLRLATQEEVKKIADGSDLDFATGVVAFPKDEGEPDLAVIKVVPELDPVYFSPTSDHRRRAMFIWALENYLRLSGTRAYYFNVKADDEAWQKVIKTSGAEQLSPGPEIRFKKVLINGNKANNHSD